MYAKSSFPVAGSLLLLGVVGCAHHPGIAPLPRMAEAPAVAEAVEPSPVALHPLEGLVRRGLDEDLSLQSLRLKVDRVRKEYTLVPDTRDPEIRWAYRRQVEDPKQYDVTVGLRIYPEAPWDWSARRKQYRLMRQLADLEEQAWEIMTAYAVRRQVEALQIAREESRCLSIALRLARDMQTAAEAQLAVGQLRWEDSMKARLEAIEADTAFREKNAGYRSALAALAVRLQWTPEQLERFIPDLEPPAGCDAPVDVEALYATALDQRLEPGAMEMQWRLQRFEKALDIPLWLPWARHLQGGYRLGENSEEDLWMVSGAVTLPLSGLTQGRSGQLETMHQEREMEVKALQRGIEAQVRERGLYYEAAREQWTHFQHTTAPVMEQLMADLEALNHFEQVAYPTIARQQQALVEALFSRITLLGKLVEAQTNLEEACGIVSW